VTHTDARTIWLDGRYVREDHAEVRATSRTVTAGLGLFETIRIVRGAAPLLDRHLARLVAAHREATARGVDLVDPSSRDWPHILAVLARRNHLRSGAARILIGDGFALATCDRLPRGLERERREGLALGRIRLAWPMAHLKTSSRAALVLAEASARGEVALEGPGAQLTETSRANLFVVTARGLETAAEPSALPGIAREIVLEEAHRLGIPVRLRAPRWGERGSWHEVFTANALRGIRPVRSIDAHAFPLPGARSITSRLSRRLDRHMGLR
jgi:branched-subunit amino acid aminotransferase/4-amino-4-deoxychorismate lyase